MPSFDVVSEVDLHEVANAVDQANREVGTRFDFKGTGARFELKDAVITLLAENEFQLQQMMDILQPRLAKRGVDLLCLKVDPPGRRRPCARVSRPRWPSASSNWSRTAG